MTTSRPLRVLAVRVICSAAVCAATGAAAVAAEGGTTVPDSPVLSASAFATLGAARSDRPWRYQRFIDDGGTVRRDTLVGAQLDAQLSPRWSATLQGKLAPSMRDDAHWDLTSTWAFAAWRPGNDWLVRAGKLRVPFLLRSEQLDVGQTYDEARLPTEVYTLAPTNDFTGAHVTHSWSTGGGELALEGYRGRGHIAKRFWLREGVPGAVPAGALFRHVDTTTHGLVLTWRAPEVAARGGLHHARTRRSDGAPILVRPVFVELAPGIGYWQTSNDLFGPGVRESASVDNYVLTVGAQGEFAPGWRATAEFVRLVQRDTELGADSRAAYLTLSRTWGHLTPYVTLAGLRSTGESTAWSRRLDTTQVPAAAPGAALLNATMRAAADIVPVFHQHSAALGASFALTARSKLKAEWLHTRSRASQAVDVPAGEPVEQLRRVNVLSASYSVVF